MSTKKIGRHAAFEKFYAARERTRLCIAALQKYMDNHSIARGGCTIHGENGPVWYENISDHPKVRAKMGPGK